VGVEAFGESPQVPRRCGRSHGAHPLRVGRNRLFSHPVCRMQREKRSLW